MIDKYRVKNYCCEDISNIENYEKAINSPETWLCHHRLGTHTSDGKRRLVDISPEELIALSMYYHRPADELIFLTHSEHQKLHHTGTKHSVEARRKMSKAQKGSKNGFFGKHHSEEWKRNISKAHKDFMVKVRQAYKEYKFSGGNLKWNDFQKQYRGE